MNGSDLVSEQDLSDVELRAWRLVQAKPVPGRHAARSAVRHIIRAQKLASDFPDIALFCSVCAEEEAATAVFHALSRLRYNGAEILNRKNHRHKAALVPFLEAIQSALQESGLPPRHILIDEIDGQDHLRLRFSLESHGQDERFLYPSPPLDFTASLDDQRYDFKVEVDRLVSDAQASSIERFVAARANERNELLYASHQGVMVVGGEVQDHISERRAIVFTVLAVYLLIEESTRPQSFAQQCLDAFVKVMALARDGPAAHLQVVMPTRIRADETECENDP